MCQTKIPLFGRDLFTWLSSFHEPEFFKTGILKIYADNDRQPFADHFLHDQKREKALAGNSFGKSHPCSLHYHVTLSKAE